MSMECGFCKKIFSSKSNLYTHQKKTKYCIELQGKEPTILYECEYCSKNFTSKQNQIEHSCKKRDDEKRLKEQENTKREYEFKIKEQENIIYNQKEIIQKLETRLEKFENVLLDSKTEKKHKKEEIPIPLKDQMSSIIIEDIKEDETVNYSMINLNNVNITSRPIDHYVNATQLCQAGGKKFNDWFRLDTTKELIRALESDAGIPASQLIEIKKGQSSHFNQGSWIHPDLSISIAQWISPQFSIQVSKWVRTLFNKGSVEIDLNLLREKDRDMRIKDHLIKELKSVCLSKQSRVEYPEKNVIYLLTTEDHLKRRTYIIGKAKNLTNRLGTYNKTCDHTVVYYKECKGEDDMDTAETMVLSKLRDYREKANRDRFILPEDKEISFFIGVIDECICFIG